MTAVSQFLCTYRWAKEPEQWNGNRRFIFSPPLVSRKKGKKDSTYNRLFLTMITEQFYIK